jgi:hypothetical protein
MKELKTRKKKEIVNESNCSLIFLKKKDKAR